MSACWAISARGGSSGFGSREKEIGLLEVGELADFIILDKDYFTIPEDQIHTIHTLLTAVGGKTVYKSPSY